MDTRTFLERVLPASGGYYFCNYGVAKKLKQSLPLATIDDLATRIAEHSARKENVYAAIGTFGETRTAANAVAKKAFYLDLDCGDGKGFASKTDAIAELKRFIEASQIPFPSIVLDSGRGIHVYWVLDSPILPAMWQPIATQLKNLCEQHGFAADGSITADLARIMRVPGTSNWKDPANPKLCRVVKVRTADYTLAEFTAGWFSPSGNVPSALVDSVDNDDLGEEQRYSNRKYSAEGIFDQCVAMKHSREVGGADQPGELWYKLVHVLAFTEDGREYVHSISNKHDQYSQQETDKRYDYAVRQKDAGVGPTLCSTIEQFLPSKCAVCPYRGHIKTPLMLGKTKESFLPAGWKMDQEGIHKPGKMGENGVVLDWIRVIPYRLTDVELYSTAFGNGLQFTAHNGPRQHTSLVLGVDLADDTKALSKSLMIDNIMMTETEILEFKRLMIPWMRKMEAVRNAKPAPLTGLGWMHSGDKIGFATGRAIFMEDGTTAPISGIDRALAREYSPRGEEAPWRDAAAAIMADGDPAISTALLSAFAAPLLTFTGVSGVMLSLHSRESGTGKSSVLKLAQAVWGDPLRGVNALNDTANSMAKKFGFLNNLPAYWDEVRMRDEVRNFVRMVFQLGQGKEKQRLTASAKMQEMGTWSTITTIATNEPVLDHVDAIASNTNAGRLRVFEVDVPMRKLEDSSVPFKLRHLATNYGHIGEDYAAWLAKNHAAVDSLVQRMQMKVSTDLVATNDERFWVALVSVLLVAAHIVNRRGYTLIDLPKYRAWLYGQFTVQRGGSAKQHIPLTQRATDAVIGYADQMRDQIVVVEHATSRSVKSVGRLIYQPQIKEFLGLLAVKDRVLRLKRAPFRAWIYDTLKESPSEIIEMLKTQGAIEAKASVSAGVANSVNARVPVLDIDLKADSFTPILEEYTEEQCDLSGT